jgi:ATP-dependent RNA helicase RhlE
MLNKPVNTATGWQNLGIKPAILAILAKLGLENPTPIQSKAIPVAVSGQDLFGIAQTGTGKTLAFGIPLVQRLAENKGRALILLPTRELATQVEESLKKIAPAFGLRNILIMGGEPVRRQLYELFRNPQIIVATPGRLLDHIKRRSIRLDNLSILVLDEADMMFDMGFAPQIEEIIKATPKTRQTLLFSATMPAAILRLAERHLSSPLKIEVAPAGSTADLVDQEIYLIRREDRLDTLEKILVNYKNLILIFVRTKYGASNLATKLKHNGHKATEIHSNLSPNQRKLALAGFKNGTQRILVATDVAARGLDISDIELVLNFDLPDNCEDYVHRIGRTARAGKGGKAISFALPTQRRDIQKIEGLIKKNLPITKIGLVQEEAKRSVMVKAPARHNYNRQRQWRPKSAPDFSMLAPEDLREQVNSFGRYQKPKNNFKKQNKFSKNVWPKK